MKGTNPVARARTSEQGMLVHSIFQTIQGEGPYAGHPAIFIRFAGCNLKCHFCDTDFEQGESYAPEQLARKVTSLRNSLPRGAFYRYVLTGGEPMLQPLFEFITYLSTMGHVPIDIETAGTVWPNKFENVAEDVSIVCSPKTNQVHERIKFFAHAWKYIIKAGETASDDGLPCRSTQFQFADARIYRPAMLQPDIVYVQPCDEGDPDKNKANLDEAARVAMRYGYRLSVQIHKIAQLP